MRLSKDATAWQSAKSHTEANKSVTYRHFYRRNNTEEWGISDARSFLGRGEGGYVWEVKYPGVNSWGGYIQGDEYPDQ